MLTYAVHQALLIAGPQLGKDETARRLVFGDFEEDLLTALKDCVLSGARDFSEAIGIDLTTAPKAAVDWATTRAARLLGTGDESITETIRDDVRRLTGEAIDGGWSVQDLASKLADTLGEARALMVARTETGFAYMEATAAVADEAGIIHLRILDGDGCLPKGHEDGTPGPDGLLGIVQLDRQADGQLWTADQVRQYKLGHPHCRRSATAFIGG